MVGIALRKVLFNSTWSRYRFIRRGSHHLKDIVIDQNEIKQQDAVSQTIKEIKATTCNLPVANERISDKDAIDYGNIGQPTPFDHPFLFQSASEITPGITRDEYSWRRNRLIEVLRSSNTGHQHENHLVILSASQLNIMTNDIPYPFHQDTDFLYLTGLHEPDAILVLESKGGSATKFYLFVKPKDPLRELWDGAVVGEKAAVKYFQSDQSFPLSSFEETMKKMFHDQQYCVWRKTARTNHMENQNKIKNLLNDTSTFRTKVVHELGFNLQMLRLIKSEAEIKILKKSSQIAAKAFARVMRSTRDGVTEHHLQALLDFYCRLQGAQFLSFPPVVASGNRANTLHYINNTQIVRSGELVLMDGGCEYNGYASDLTRTWPVNGVFSEAQRQLYQIVLNVQHTCIQECKPGVTLDKLHNTMIYALARELGEIGFINRTIGGSQLRKAVNVFCPHHLGHYLGMDTHDTPLVHRGLPLQPGMAITIEPGLYIPHNQMDVPERYRGIGIRIEDNILITEHGNDVISEALPKNIADLEELMKT